MKTAEDLLRRLGIKLFTKRHIQLINDFIDSNDTDIEKLLNNLGDWDQSDLVKANEWFNQ